MSLLVPDRHTDIILAAPLVGVLISEDWIIRTSAVLVGLIFGAMWRAGSLKSEGKAWTTIKTDLLISVLIGGANAVLALALIDWLAVGPLFSMVVGVIVGATGLQTLPTVRDAVVEAARRRLLEQGIAMITPHDHKIEELLEELAQRVDKENEQETGI